MVDLNKFERYFNRLADRLGIKPVFFFTDEGNIREYVQDIAVEDKPFLMVIIPSGKAGGSVQDALEDRNYGLLYLLSKEERTGGNSFAIQKRLQPTFEALKQQMADDKEECDVMRGLVVSSLTSDPESKLFSELTGWSLGFEF